MEFQTKDITAITNVKRNRLQSWIESGFISPSISGGGGSGSKNLWSKDDIYRIEIFKRLVESGFSRKLASNYKFQSVDKRGIHEDLLNLYYILYMRKGKKIKTMQIYERSIDFGKIAGELGMAGFEDVYIINFQGLMGETDRKIRENRQ
jgi:hypothetical protein